MKKAIAGLVIVLSAGLGWFFYSELRLNAWSGESEAGKWKAVYEQEGRKDKWFGTLQWNGEGEPVITYMEFKINGIHSAGDGEPDSERQTRAEEVEKNIGFIDFGGEPEHSDNLELMLHWTEGGSEFEEVIILHP